MKKSEFKKIVKPVVKECLQESIHEILLESGILSSIISEVVSGLSPMLTERKRVPNFYIEDDEPQQPSMIDRSGALREINESFESDLEKQNNAVFQEMFNRQAQSRQTEFTINGVNVFEGLTPTDSSGLNSSGQAMSAAEQEMQAAGALSEEQGTVSDMERNFLKNTFKDKWKRHMSRKFERTVIPTVIEQRKHGRRDSRGLFQNSNQIKKAANLLSPQE